jgi:hypothetical protein
MTTALWPWAVLRKRRDLRILIPRSAPDGAHEDEEFAKADVVIADYELGLRLSETGRESGGRVMILTHGDSEEQIAAHCIAARVGTFYWAAALKNSSMASGPCMRVASH